MTDFIDDVDRDEWAEFEELGRRAGAALRALPPEAAIDDLERVVRRRGAVRGIGGAAVILFVLLGVSWAAARWVGDRGGAPAGPSTDNSAVTEPLPSGAPGTWRALPPPAAAPEVVVSATWTGDDVIVLGMDGSRGEWRAIALDVRADRWRRIAPPTLAATVGYVPRPAWTGRELLAADFDGGVFSYDPRFDVWRERTAAPFSVVPPTPQRVGLVQVSPFGVLTTSADGSWWWYDERADEWSEVADPPIEWQVADQGAGSVLDGLSASELVLVNRGEENVEFVVFDAPSRTWTSPRDAAVPYDARSRRTCAAVDGRLVCSVDALGKLSGVVIDVATLGTESFGMGSHSNELQTSGIPWWGHAWSLLVPRTATWEAMPELAGVTGFGAAAWTGSEIVMVGGTMNGGERFAAAYTPKEAP